jgi:cardiolipin synthase A/B
MYRKILITLAAAGLGLSVAACSGTVPGQDAASDQVGHTAAVGTSAVASTSVAVESATARRSSSPAASLQLLTEPGSGIGPIYKLITKAKHSVDLTMYELADSAAEADLAADAARHVDVRVILDRHLEKSANTKAYNYLSAHGVHVRWAPAGTTYHQKTLTVDNATSVIMTLNLVARDYPGTRDFAVIDTGRTDVAAIVATFNADFAGRLITPPDGADLVWSPTNAKREVLSVINGAKHTLTLEDEEMNDPAVTAALAAAARRGVHVTITMTADSEWDQAFTELARAGAHIRLYPDKASALYIHAKAIVADAGRSGQRVLVGSQNFSVASLGYNRELGLLTSNGHIVAAISATLAGDYAKAAAGSSATPPPTG